MNMRQEVLILKRTLTGGDPTYTKHLNSLQHQYTVNATVGALIKLIEGKVLSHQDYWVAVRGLGWTLNTGRAGAAQTLWMRGMKVDDVLKLIVEIKQQQCHSLEEVATSIRTIHLMQDSSTGRFLRVKRKAKVRSVKRALRHSNEDA